MLVLLFSFLTLTQNHTVLILTEELIKNQTNRYFPFKAVPELIQTCLILRLVVPAEYRRSNEIPCLCDTVTAVSCGKNALTTTSLTLSSYHTRMHNPCSFIYLQNGFWSHCHLTLRGKNKSS